MRKTSEIIWQDAQHQVLFEILDTLGEPDSDSETVRRLRHYIETHFALEEQYMEKLDYAGFAAHKQAHDSFRREIDSLLERDHDAQFSNLVATFLTEWLTRHVFGIDKELEMFILQSSVK